jgi:putative SOS response-associated peptidase YedK
MIDHYQGTRERETYASRFGIAFQPGPQILVRPGESGIFVRRPRADHPGSLKPLSRFEAVTGRWGLIPLFSKDGQDPLFEAQAESAAAERNFLQPWKRGHRCVVLADALVEALPAGSLLQRSRADGRALAIAGLWNGWRSPQGQCVESFAIFTVRTAQGRREPALLHDAWLEDWLNCPVEETAAYLRPYSPSAELVTREVERS